MNTFREKEEGSYTRKTGLPPESPVFTGKHKPSPAELEVLVDDDLPCEKEQIREIRKPDFLVDNNKVNLLQLMI
jgi:hypothetical protein